jgi:cytochrome c oxidase cbb3-type subunit 3
MSEVKRHDPIQGDIVHEYDGIEEADNALPKWWLATFFGAIAFGIVYWLAGESFHTMPTLADAYSEEMAARLGAGGEMTDEALATLSEDDATVALGRRTFEANCVACHGDHAQGNIGPNLTDDHWIHGGAPTSIYGTVRDGVSTRGMPTWGPVLGDHGVQSVVAYVLSIRNTNVPGRPPEGDPWTPAEPTASPTTDATSTTGAIAPTATSDVHVDE